MQAQQLCLVVLPKLTANCQALVRIPKRRFRVGELGLHFTCRLCLTVLITVLLLQVSELRLELHDLVQCLF